MITILQHLKENYLKEDMLRPHPRKHESLPFIKTQLLTIRLALMIICID